MPLIPLLAFFPSFQNSVGVRGPKVQLRFSIGQTSHLQFGSDEGRLKDVPGEPFVITMKDGRRWRASDFRIERIAGPRADASNASFRLVNPTSGLSLVWKLSAHSHYVRTILTLTAVKAPAAISDVEMFEASVPAAKVIGAVPGSPIVAGNWFFAAEHPMAESALEGDRATSRIRRRIPLSAGASVEYSAVYGYGPENELRRGFLDYLEAERPRQYRPFLHYNSWYDLGYFTKYNADQCLERIRRFGEELSSRRKVKLSSFLFDDGWDDTSTVWKFHSGFPQGFAPLAEAAKAYGAAPGIWLSPWGGYGKPRQQRLEAGKAAGMEIDREGYALSGPRYYRLFHDFCLNMVRTQGINQFKLDGTGSPDKQYPGSAFASDFEAAIALIRDLRAAKPELFVNLTTGTWPSPFWTRYADSLWRGGEDHSFAGTGTWRQRWITYRDGDLFHGVVQRGPLYPMNSLMLHGIIYAQHAQHLGDDPGHDFREEVHSYFGTGTQLEEMYITPDLLTKENWDDLAASANWAQTHRKALRDSHWVGGDPLKGEVYGYAGWSPDDAVITLRNPSDTGRLFSLDPAVALEIPATRTPKFLATEAYPNAARKPMSFTFPSGKATQIFLRPYQVLVMNLKATR